MCVPTEIHVNLDIDLRFLMDLGFFNPIDLLIPDKLAHWHVFSILHNKHYFCSPQATLSWWSGWSRPQVILSRSWQSRNSETPSTKSATSRRRKETTRWLFAGGPTTFQAALSRSLLCNHIIRHHVVIATSQFSRNRLNEGSTWQRVVDRYTNRKKVSFPAMSTYAVNCVADRFNCAIVQEADQVVRAMLVVCVQRKVCSTSNQWTL